MGARWDGYVKSPPDLSIKAAAGDWSARQSSIYAMGRTSDPQWANRVVEDLEHDVVSVRYEATMAIGELGDESHLRALEGPLDAQDLTVQLAAISAGERIGGALATSRLASAEGRRGGTSWGHSAP